ncbi:MAG: pre-16S rRNA-processing nuclease YqgF [Trueperaceae bacterium]|nr:pre-16S rRNA-processing nuclease YqgF [Trueperaceae bacterium]
MLVAFDPGRNLGVAFVSETGELLRHEVVSLGDLERLELPHAVTVLVGDGTGSAAVVAALRGRGLEPVLVPEEGTTLEARALYFADHPPKGLGRLVPPGLRSAPVAIDDYAAYAVALRWLAERGAGEEAAGAPPA